MHCLVAYAPNGVRRFAIDRPELLIGSGDACDVRLPFAGVSAEHARLRERGGYVEIEDLGTRKGVLVNGKRVREARLEALDEIRLGSIALLLEDVVQEARDEPAPENERAPEPRIDPPVMLEHLSRISQWVLSDSSSSTPLESLVVALLADFGGGVLFLFQGEDEGRGIKFVVASEARWLGHGQEILDQIEAEMASGPAAGSSFEGRLEDREAWIAWRPIRALDRPYLFTVVLPAFRARDWSPWAGFCTLADQLILGLVHHVGQYEPILFGQRTTSDLTLVPDLIVGESPTMQTVIQELRTLIDPPVHVLMRGEAGVSKELLARSLHISGPLRDGPFVVATCRGAKPLQIEADLFGAELRGKTGPVVREGKLLEADGGTLFLQSVELLPLALQDRLMRFLRSGEIMPAESPESETVDVRLIVTSDGPLETYVARDQFRIDLAHRLSQFVVDVPPLRERREDLPLLIQAAVNRCCHDAGKRVQGITVKALEALAVYNYPGNLTELENIIRRLVYLCPPGQPINAAMLPEEVQLAKLAVRPETRSDLDLERLVNDTERAAIREALQRSRGNKSEAARLLSLSRNGLAMKMSRLGLTS